MEARVIVYTPPRLYSFAENLARNVAMLYSGACSVDVLVVPSLEDGEEPSVVAEGGECGLSAAEMIQSMLWLFESIGAPEPFVLGVEHVLSARGESSVGLTAP